MSLNKRVKGDYTIESIDSGDKIVLHEAGGITITGDLIVTGASSLIQSTNTTIVDNQIVLNSGELGAGISEGESGIEIDRGGSANVGIRYNETLDYWEANDVDVASPGDWYPLNASIAASFNLVSDLTPQLGGDLDVNGFSITSAAGGDIVIVAGTTGLVKLDQDLSFKEQVTDETPTAGYNKLYAKTVGKGGSGMYFANSTDADELVSRKKAILYGLIF